MKLEFRAVAALLALSLAWAGPLAPLAAAQQPTTTQLPPPPAAAAPHMYQEIVEPVPERGADVYDAGAAALTVIGLPFKGALCALGFLGGGVLFVATFAARPDAAFGILDEGCGGKARWIVRGEDIRPHPSATKVFEWETYRTDRERR